MIDVDYAELLDEVRLFLPRISRASSSVSELFYEPINKESLSIIEQVTEGINNLYQMLIVINKGMNSHSYIRIEIKEIMVELSNMMASLNLYLKEQNMVFAGDIIRYEMIPLFENLALLLGEEKTVQSERFNENLEYLKQNFPDVYKFVADLDLDNERYQTIFSADGSPNLYILFPNQNPFYLYSKYSPGYEAKRWAESIHEVMKGKKKVLLFGVGLGYHLSELLEQYPGVQVSLYEPDEQVLISAMRTVRLSEVLIKTRIGQFAVGKDKKGIQPIADSIFYSKDEIVNLEIPIYSRKFKESKEFLINAINLAMEVTIIADNTLKKSSSSWTKSSLYNVSKNLATKPFDGMLGAFDGLSAVIVGAGPSLELDVEYVKRLKNHAIIIAAGSTVQTLQHFGIEPHLIVSMDGTEENYIAFKKINMDFIPFLYFPQIEYRIIENRPSEYLMHGYYKNDILTNYLMGVTPSSLNFIPTHSVTGSAIQAAVHMGCKEIILAGQDFSYPCDRFYSSGASHIDSKKMDKIISEAALLVENVQGSMNRTDVKLKLTRENIEEVLEQFPNIRFVNTSRMGAVIKNTLYEPINETLARLKHVQVLPAIVYDEMKRISGYSIDRTAEITNRLSSLPQELHEISLRLHKVKQHLVKVNQLKKTNLKKCLAEMVMVEELWGKVVHTKAFNSLYLRNMASDIMEFDRKRPEIFNEKNIEKQADLFIDVLGKLINEMSIKNSFLEEHVAEAIRRVKELGFN